MIGRNQHITFKLLEAFFSFLHLSLVNWPIALLVTKNILNCPINLDPGNFLQLMLYNQTTPNVYTNLPI